MPGGCATGYQMVGAGQALPLGAGSEPLNDGMGGDVGDQISPRGGAKLVVNDGELVALLGQAQHGFGEVAPACGVDPTGAKNEVVGAVVSNAFFTVEFGGTVDV